MTNDPVERIAIPDGDRSFSRVAWGMGSLPREYTAEQSADMLRACVDLGITTIDNAENYGGYTREALLGEAMVRAGGIRNRLELVTKCGCVGRSPDYPEYAGYHYDTRKEHIVAAAERSLRMFRTDRLDALLLHRPDPLMDADEIAEAFLRLRGDGKVLSFGVSNFSPSQMGLLASRLPFPLSFNEIQASVLHPDPILDGTLDYCQLHGIIPMAWGPLGRGELFTGSSERVLAMRELLSRIGAGAAGTDGPGIDAVALAWLRMLPSRVVPILGTGTAEELRSCLRPCAVGREQWYSILCASTGKGLA